MTAPTTTSPAQAYLADVEAELADLPADERRELLEDLATHLAAIEEEHDERPLTARLGAPADYAAELRSAAGLPARSGGAPKPRREAFGALASRVSESRAGREVRAFVPQLRPAWWVLRGYLAIAIPCLWGADGSRDFPVPAPSGSHLLGLVLVTAAIVASVALGRRRLPTAAVAAVVALNALVLLAAADLLHDWRWRVTQGVVYASASAVDPFEESPLASRHGPVTNVFPYSSDGKPLDGVLLFDQDGRPLLTGSQQWWADQCRRIESAPRAADGVPVAFSYPKPYVLDPAGTTLDGVPATAGQCTQTLPRPTVPLPTFAPR